MKKYKSILIIFIVSIMAMLPYFIRPANEGHDSLYHYTNVIEVKNSILENPPFGSFIVGGIANDFGYGTRLFYPPLGHTSIALLDLVINNIEISFKAFNYLIVFLSGLSLYYLSKKISNNEKIAVIAAIVYMVFPYHLADIFIRDALAETLVFVFIPIIFNAIYSLFYKDGKNFYPLFVLGYVGGILSHSTMMLYFTFLIAIFLILNIKRVFTKKIFFKLLFASFFVLGITSFFWVNMLIHNIVGDYLVFKEGVMVQGTQGNGLLLYEYFSFFKPDDVGIIYYIDIVALVLLIVSVVKIVIDIKNKQLNKIYFYIILLLSISVFMSTVFFPWDLFPKSLRVIQFPWRMVTYVALFASLIIPYCLKNISSKLYYIIIGLLIISSYLNFNSLESKEMTYYYHDEIAMGWQREYLPVNTGDNMDYFNNRDNSVIVSNGESLILENNTPYLKFEVTQRTIAELPRIFYFGYELTNISGEKINIYENENGFIEAELESGIYTLNYKNTTASNIAILISISSLLVFGGLRWKKLV